MIVCLKKIFRDLERLKEFINTVLGLQGGFRIKEIEFIPIEQALCSINKKAYLI